MNRLGAFSAPGGIGMAGAALVSLAWGALGKLAASVTPAIPEYLFILFWPFAGAFITQAFYQTSKAAPWRIALGLSGATGLMAAALAGLIQKFAALAGAPSGDDVAFMVAILVSLRGIEPTMLVLDGLVARWFKKGDKS